MTMGVKEAALTRAISLLSAVGAQYIIVSPEGGVYSEGELQLAETKKRKKRAPRGTYKHILITAGLDEMQVGQVLKIPKGKLELDHLQRLISSRSCSLWGPGAVTTATLPDGIEVLRIV